MQPQQRVLFCEFSLPEVLLLDLDNPGDIGLLLPQLRILAFILMDDGVHHTVEEWLVDTQELSTEENISCKVISFLLISNLFIKSLSYKYIQ